MQNDSLNKIVEWVILSVVSLQLLIMAQSITTDNTTEKDQDTLQRILERFNVMEKYRSKYYQLRSLIELMVDEDFEHYTSNGKLTMRVPQSRNKIEFSLGGAWQLIDIDVESDEDWVSDIDAEVAKYATEYFINEELVHHNIKRFRYRKAKYWHAFLGVSIDTEYMPQDSSEDWMPGDENETPVKMEKLDADKRHRFRIKDYSVRDVRTDETTTSPLDEVDVAYREIISWDEFLLNFTKTIPQDFKSWDTLQPKKGFRNVDKIMANTNYQKEGVAKWRGLSYENSVEIVRYENRITGKLYIIANRATVIYSGPLQTPDGGLSIHGCQHYIDTERKYGVGIVEKSFPTDMAIWYLYKLLMEDVRISNARFLWIGWEDGKIEDWFYIEEGEIQEINFSWEINNLKQIERRSNVWTNIALLDKLREQNIEDSGYDLRSSIGGTAFEVNAIMERLSERVWSIVQDEQIMMDSLFTQYVKTILKRWQILNNTSKDKKIKIKGKKIKRDDKKILNIEDDPDGFDWLPISALNKEARWMKVVVNTPSTKSVLKAVEMENIPKYVQTLMTLKQLHPELDIGDGKKTLRSLQRATGLWWSDDYKSRSQRIKEEASSWVEVVNNLANLFTWQTPPNEDPNTQQWGVPALPGAPGVW